jgi:hypothetical protein
MAGGGATGTALKNDMNAWKKITSLLRPAILVMGENTGDFAGMAANTIRRIRDNKFIHLLPFIILK